MVKVIVPLSVELPEKIVELLAEHGDEFVLALGKLVQEAKWAEKTEQARIRSEQFAQILIQRKIDLLIEGRLYHRILRGLLDDIPKRIKGKTRTAYRNDFIAIIAYRNRLDIPHVDLEIKLHRRKFLAKFKQRRSREILRLFVDGLTDQEIASQLRIADWLVPRTLTEFRKKSDLGWHYINSTLQA